MSGPAIDLLNPYHLIAYAAEQPGQVAAIPLLHPALPDQRLVLSAKIRRQPIPAHMQHLFVQPNGGSAPPTHVDTGRLLTIVPADVARNIRGEEAGRDVLYLFVVKREAYARAESGIVLPGRVARAGSGPLIVSG